MWFRKRPKQKENSPGVLHHLPRIPLPFGWGEAFLSADEENDESQWGFHAGLVAPTPPGLSFWDLPDEVYASKAQIRQAMDQFHRDFARYHPWRPCWRFWNMP